MLGVTVNAVALVVVHEKLMNCPAAVIAGVDLKPAIAGALGPPPVPPPLPPLPPPLPPLPPLPTLPPPEPELDPPPHATANNNIITLTTEKTLRNEPLVERRFSARVRTGFELARWNELREE